MMDFLTANVVTEDNFVLQGFLMQPEGKKVAIIFIHGFSSNFFKNIDIIRELVAFGYTTFSLNTRGHDVLSVVPKIGKGNVVIGSAKENFEDCIFDIDGSVKLLRKSGIKKIFLMGISSGADKVAFYLSKSTDVEIKGGILVSPGSNIAIIKKELGGDFEKLMKESLERVRMGRGDELLCHSKMKIPVSYKRFVSLYSEESNENAFPFHREETDFPILSKIKKPIFVALGEKDPFHKDPRILLKMLKSKLGNRKNEFKSFKAGHSFIGSEDLLAWEITRWIGRIS